MNLIKTGGVEKAMFPRTDHVDVLTITKQDIKVNISRRTLALINYDILLIKMQILLGRRRNVSILTSQAERMPLCNFAQNVAC